MYAGELLGAAEGIERALYRTCKIFPGDGTCELAQTPFVIRRQNNPQSIGNHVMYRQSLNEQAYA